MFNYHYHFSILLLLFNHHKYTINISLLLSLFFYINIIIIITIISRIILDQTTQHLWAVQIHVGDEPTIILMLTAVSWSRHVQKYIVGLVSSVWANLFLELIYSISWTKNFKWRINRKLCSKFDCRVIWLLPNQAWIDASFFELARLLQFDLSYRENSILDSCFVLYWFCLECWRGSRKTSNDQSIFKVDNKLRHWKWIIMLRVKKLS